MAISSKISIDVNSKEFLEFKASSRNTAAPLRERTLSNYIGPPHGVGQLPSDDRESAPYLENRWIGTCAWRPER